MKKKLFLPGILFLAGVYIFPQNLSNERMALYTDFQEFSTEFQYWYYERWINIEWGFMDMNAKGKYRNINEFGNEMMEKVRFAIERSRADFRNKVYNDKNFINEVKSLLEKLNANVDTSTINNWNFLLAENGYSLDKYDYNNIERMGYNFLFFTNACMFMDQEFPGNNITDSVIKKMEVNLNSIREGNNALPRDKRTTVPSYEDAEKAFEDITDLITKHEKYTDAIELATRVMEGFPNDERFYYLRGYCYMVVYLPEAAKEDYLACIRINPNNGDGYYGLANLYKDEGLFELAEINYNTAIKLASDDFRKAVYYAEFASFFSEQDDNKKAVELINQAVELADISDFYFSLGLYLYIEGNKTEAESALTDGLAKNSFRQIYFKSRMLEMLAQINYEREDYQAAKGYIENALELAPDDFFYLELWKEICDKLTDNSSEDKQ